MSYRLSYLPTAKFDMREIKEYLESEYSSSVCDRVVGEIKERILDLETMPKMYPVSQDDPRFRRMVCENYLVFYTLDETNYKVEIHHIWHGMRNIRAQLKRKP
ncbi:MAG: type II toxin-antitoxin system RelE/ParE family toxin [Clostridia bacterium]|nr:type II toxin-antitoxin system RelE/ParE family toxin [Clostridia bacterium]